MRGREQELEWENGRESEGGRAREAKQSRQRVPFPGFPFLPLLPLFPVCAHPCAESACPHILTRIRSARTPTTVARTGVCSEGTAFCERNRNSPKAATEQYGEPPSPNQRHGVPRLGGLHGLSRCLARHPTLHHAPHTHLHLCPRPLLRRHPPMPSGPAHGQPRLPNRHPFVAKSCF